MIEIKNLHFGYPGDGEKFILEGINLLIEERRSVSIMGANGSGKTTLARCLNGILKPTLGQVLVDGLDTTDETENFEVRKLVGMVFQNPDNQIVSTTVEREVAFGLENLGIDSPEMHERVKEVLDDFGLSDYRLRSPHYLSGGEKQLLAVAAVLAIRPKYLILDEPTSLLDPFSRDKILAMTLQDGKFLQQVTPILITQFPDETLHTERLIILHEGHVFIDGSPAEVFKHRKSLAAIGVGVPVEWELKEWLREDSLVIS